MTKSTTLCELAKDPQAALLVIDLQPDFYPGGPLPVEGGDQVAEWVAPWMQRFETVVVTKDSHPQNSISFARFFEGKKAFDTLSLEEVRQDKVVSAEFSKAELVAYLEKNPQKAQRLWPVHCVRGTPGWEIDARLPMSESTIVLSKGTRREADSLSAFSENDGASTGLGAMLRERGIKKLVVTGLAGDYCVYWTAKDGIREGFQVVLPLALTRFVNFPENSREQALEDLKLRGAQILAED
ncbi:MAG: isochorismatase family protein [Bradymonadales bacterium]|nr:MAG: isochorismatase family protein [Bradymonadales bacterium]